MIDTIKLFAVVIVLGLGTGVVIATVATYLSLEGGLVPAQQQETQGK